MSHALTEVAADADFGTGPGVPDPGDDFTDSCALVLQTIQELADRTQALRKMLGMSAGGEVEIAVPLSASFNLSSRWTLSGGSTQLYYLQTNVTDAGALWFPLALPVGAKLISVTTRLAGGAPFTSPYTHSGLPATKPTVTVIRQTDGTGTTVATATDGAANVGAYDAFHGITVTANHTVVSAAHYFVKVTGEASTNSNASVLSLAGLSAVIGFA